MRVFIILGAAAAVSAPAMAQPPEIRTPPPACRCEAAAPENAVVFEGIAIDAEITVDETGAAPAARQATVFRVTRRVDGAVENPARVFHVTDPDDCGVAFDYGKRYRVAARETEDALETDRCLIAAVAPQE